MPSDVEPMMNMAPVLLKPTILETAVWCIGLSLQEPLTECWDVVWQFTMAIFTIPKCLVPQTIPSATRRRLMSYTSVVMAQKGLDQAQFKTAARFPIPTSGMIRTAITREFRI